MGGRARSHLTVLINCRHLHTSYFRINSDTRIDDRRNSFYYYHHKIIMTHALIQRKTRRMYSHHARFIHSSHLLSLIPLPILNLAPKTSLTTCHLTYIVSQANLQSPTPFISPGCSCLCLCVEKKYNNERIHAICNDCPAPDPYTNLRK